MFRGSGDRAEDAVNASALATAMLIEMSSTTPAAMSKAAELDRMAYPNACAFARKEKLVERHDRTQSFGSAYTFPLEPRSAAKAHDRTGRHSSFRMSRLQWRAGSSTNDFAGVSEDRPRTHPRPNRSGVRERR